MPELRQTTRINYKVLGETGRVTPLIESNISTQSTQSTDASNHSTDMHQDMEPPSSPFNSTNEERISIQVMCAEIPDLINENKFDHIQPDELKSLLSKFELMRKSIRTRSLRITLSGETVSDDLKTTINAAMEKITNYIQDAKDHNSTVTIKEEKKRHDEFITQKEQTLNFNLRWADSAITELEAKFKRTITNEVSSSLLNWRKDVKSDEAKFNKISDSYKECLQTSTSNMKIKTEIKLLGERFFKLDILRKSFMENLNKEISDRELDIHSEFKLKKLNIHIDKFAGYDSKTDFYTFRTNFEKVHLSSTPKAYLPDLLVNNYLTDPAYTMVKNLESIDEIWQRLEQAFGDTRMMLKKKISQLKSLEISRKNPDKLVSGISNLISMMQEMAALAKKHEIEEYLYYGDTLTHIQNLLGDGRTTRFLSDIFEDDLTPRETWTKMITFLMKERRIAEQKLLLKDVESKSVDIKQKDQPKNTKDNRYGHFHNSYVSSDTSNPVCALCETPAGESDHVASSGSGKTKLVQYYTCQKFAELTPANRLSLLKNKGYCFQCLFPGAATASGKHKDGKCQHDFVCPNASHRKYQVRKHVLVCEEHKEEPANINLLEKFKERFFRSPNLPSFTKNISLSFHSATYQSNDQDGKRGIYMLQEVVVNQNKLLIFYDSGCSDFVVSQKAVNLLGPNAIKESSTPVILGGVGNSFTKSTLGRYVVNIPLSNGQTASLTGPCIPQITSTFPTFSLGEAEKDINKSYFNSGGSKHLPKLPSSIGGDVHMMIGIRYLRYFPKIIHQTSSGLSIFESSFTSASGGRGVIAGPHPSFSPFHTSCNFSLSYQLLRKDSSDVPLLGFNAHLSTSMRVFEEVEGAGSEITYRCPNCRNCNQCRNDESNEAISIKEEIEQSLINSSVTIDSETQTTTATLPFIADPSTRLANNKDIAMKVFNQQLRKLNKPCNQNDKEDILTSEAKLQSLGYVDYVSNLPESTQRMLNDHQCQHYIPWRAVWKGNSISTPCRIVFDGSSTTSSGYSLNDLLAKGRNTLNRLQEVLIRFFIHPIAMHTDIKKMYNTIKLDESHWCYQRYVWQDSLDPSKIPQEKVVKTLIYGVKSSGNQAEYGLRRVAELSKAEYPEIEELVKRDIYVDDCLTGEQDRQTAYNRADQLERVINRGGFNLKGFVFSGEDPPPTMSEDGEMIHIAGFKWYVKSDMVSLNIGDLNFAKKCRGKKPTNQINVIPSKLTRRHCASKVAEMFDLTGKVSPLIASMKIDLQDLVQRKLDWDDVIPEALRPLWESNFQLMQEAGNLKFNRAVVPVDAVNLSIETLDFGDASSSMVCVAIYARFLRSNGEHSCQLIFSRTRSVPKEMSQPRGELYAALINTHTGEIVKRSLSKWYQSSLKFTDSQIVLYWLDNDQKPLKQWVRNRVIESLRFTTRDQWKYIPTKEMIADIGTRKGATIEDVNNKSTWINGHSWMHKQSKDFPVMTAQELRLTDQQLSEVNKEVQVYHTTSIIPEEVGERYRFSSYIIDPNAKSFSKVVCILSYVYRYFNNLRSKLRSNGLLINLDHPQHSMFLSSKNMKFNLLSVIFSNWQLKKSSHSSIQRSTNQFQP